MVERSGDSEVRLIAERIVETIVETAHEEQTLNGTQSAIDLMEFVMEELTATIVNSALRIADALPDASAAQKVALTSESLREAKLLLEEAIANGFHQAFYQFSGQLTEHVVEIRMVDGGDTDAGNSN